MRRDTLFFLFTDWDQVRSTQTAQSLDVWPPFAAAMSQDMTTMSAISYQINIRLDSRLNGVVDPQDRIYFDHTKRGVALIQLGDSPHWGRIQGAIVDLQTTSSNHENSEKLSTLVKGLAREAPEYLRSEVKILICLLPGAETQLPPLLSSCRSFKVRRTQDSKTLASNVSDWLTEFNVRIEDDTINAPEDVRKAVNELLDRMLA